MIDLHNSPFGSCRLSQVLGIKGFVVVAIRILCL